MPQQRVLILLNSKSGTLANSATHDEPERIRRGFASAGLDADVQDADPANAKRQIQSARESGFSAVVVGGGDGTINAIANAVADTHRDGKPELVFAVLPLGTHNHFAKEMGVPDDLESAVPRIARAVADNTAEPLDMAEINGTLLLNFSGIGLHPELVESRDREHKQIRKIPFVSTLLRKFTKPLSMAVAFARSIGEIRLLRLGIDADGKRRTVISPAVVIGNNVHQMEVFGVSGMSVCRRDALNAYIARVKRPIALVRLLIAAATGSLAKMREFECVSGKALTIHYRRPTLKVSVDGEVMKFKTPLRYRIRKNALKVVQLSEVAASAATAVA
ncbi:diacylglycerol/lipid kinase family protein [Humisphaera borealis]|uniref:DAGKc domain-containing protein n=1 Tax=Humisphaera borealis TaxID=2807512 RepID=A0A7M2WST9_9BACT|nr:diacylglycerol kinase family protein [Humisphaera borealis]QOV88568.1 hypothetical protein IPV69_20330 [Humisphaera borealis]